MQILVWLVGGALLAGGCLLWLRERRVRRLFAGAGLPSFPSLPFLGNALQFYGGGESIFRRIVQMSAISEKTAKPFLVWLGPKPILLCHDPDDVRTISNSLLEKPYYYSFGKIWLGDGLVTAPASLWKQTVKKLSGVFSLAVVAGYQGVFNARAQALVQVLKRKAGAEPFDVMEHLACTTLEAICQTALGVSRIHDSVETDSYYKSFNRCLELLIERGLNLLLHVDCLYKLTSAHKELSDNIAVLHNVSNTVLKKRKLERKMINERDTKEESKFRPVLDILLDISESDPLFTEQQIRSEVDTIILGGQETVASTTYFTLLMLGARPKVQNRLYEEVRNIFGDSKRPVEKEDLARMVYCEAVVCETLRLFPPLPGVMRYADKEIKLKSCTVPIGTCCAINAWGAGRSKRSWGPDAEEYRPERWLAGDVPSTAAAFLAFSYGRRSCIGKKYAMAIMKTLLAYCVRELEFTSDADSMQFKVDIALRPISGHLIQIKLRNDNRT